MKGDFQKTMILPNLCNKNNNSNVGLNLQCSCVKNEISFKGIEKALGGGKRFVIDNCDEVIKFLDSKYGNLFKNLKREIPADAFKKVFDGGAIRDESMFQKVVNSFLYPFTGMWKDIYGGIVGSLAKKSTMFEKLNNAEFLQRHRDNKIIRENVQSLRGALEEVGKIYNKIVKENGDKIPENIEELVVKQTDDMLRNYMSKKTGNYNTSAERSLNRIVSGLVPAFFLATDIYNMSLRNGMTEEQAKASAYQRMQQEFIRTGATAYTTYGTLNAFDKLTNTIPVMAPLITTGTVAAVESGSRLAVGKSLIPEKLPDSHCERPAGAWQSRKYLSPKVLTDPNCFKGNAGNNDLYWITPFKSDEKKKHYITAKNVALFCAASIVGGFSILAAKRQIMKTEFGKNILKRRNDWIDNNFRAKLEVNVDDMNTFVKRVKEADFKDLAERYRRVLDGNNSDILNGDIYKLNKLDKLVKIPFTNMKVPLIEIVKTALVPFKLIKDLALLPYKFASSIVLAAAKLSGTEAGTKIAKFIEGGKKDQNDLAMISTAYQNYLRKGGENLNDEGFKKYIENTVRTAFNKSTSGIDNAKLGRMTKDLVSMVTLYFVVLDDYILSLKQTKNKDTAAQKGRERFVQNVMRMAVQLSLMDLFNNIFRIQYNNSLAGMAHIVFWNTVATDIVTRKLVGKPITPMSKEKQEAHAKKTENGVAGKYHKFMNMLAK